MKSSIQQKLTLIALTAILLSSAVLATTYPVLVAKVPFKFSMGKRDFAPGEYHFAAIGVGRLAVLDANKKIIAVFMTRTPETLSVGSSTQLVFAKSKDRAELTRIFMGGNEQEILAEEPAGHDRRKESIPVDSFMQEKNVPLPVMPR